MFDTNITKIISDNWVAEYRYKKNGDMISRKIKRPSELSLTANWALLNPPLLGKVVVIFLANLKYGHLRRQIHKILVHIIK